MTESERYGKWEVVEPISRGGQGQVYLVRDVSGATDESERWRRLKKAIATLNGAGEQWRYEEAGSQLADEIRRIANESQVPKGALKKLLPFEEGAAEDEAAALDRMKRELSVLESVSHPSLVKVLDSRLDEKWFVMEYLGGGKLSDRLVTYKGRVLDALKAVRPIVDAVCALHTEQVIHRDIKPDNIFVASDGHLVLGDCGLAFKVEAENRLTLTWENVGTREFQPPWSYGTRLADVQADIRRVQSRKGAVGNGVPVGRSFRSGTLTVRRTTCAGCSRMNLLSTSSTKSSGSALWNRRTRWNSSTQVRFSTRSTVQFRRCRMAASCLDGSAGCGVGSAVWGSTRR